MANIAVLYDACVIYPAPLRDFLMELTLSGLYRAKWSAYIHEEWIRNVLKTRADITREQLYNIRDLMDLSAADALVFDYENIIPSLELPDKNDRHVLAAAIRSSASVILTFNLKDFPALVLESYGIEAQHPDDFISNLIDKNPALVCSSAKLCRNRLKQPPLDVERYLNNLERQSLPATVAKLREFEELL